MTELTEKELKDESFKVLQKFKEICEKNGFKYCLMYGTLIGAIRHGGFIPWDDDIDVMMPRPDYEKFVAYCAAHKEELKPLELMHYKTNEKYIYPIARLSNSDFFVDYKNTKDYGLGCFVDIYPFDGVNYDDKKHIRKLRTLMKMVGVKSHVRPAMNGKPLKYPFKLVAFYLFKLFDTKKLIEKLDLLSQKYDYETSDYVECVCWEAKFRFDKSLFDNMVMRKFEDDVFCVPERYDELLKAYYGDYMALPPENERYGHHFYKAYRK